MVCKVWWLGVSLRTFLGVHREAVEGKLWPVPVSPWEASQRLKGPLCPRTSDAWHPKHVGDNAYFVLSCSHPLPKYCQKPAHTWGEAQNQILLRNLNILLHKSHSIKFSRNREKWKKKNLSQESHGGNLVRSVKFLFSALSHSLSKPFLFWKVPHTGAPRDPPAVLMARGSHCMTFSCSWPSPASGLLQTGLQLGSLHTYNSQMNPEEPTRGLSNYANRDKALYSTRTCRDPAGSWHGWDGQLYQLVQNTHTHTHTHKTLEVITLH